MKVTSAHHVSAKEQFTGGAKTKTVQAFLMKGKDGLTKAQACSCAATARKQLGIYKKGSVKVVSNDADKQAEMKTEINQD